MGRLAGKVAIITGAGSGIGRAGALIFAKEGAKVVVADWAAVAGEETVDIIKQAGGEAIFVKTDVTKADDVSKMVRTAVDTYGKLDIIWNNAGIPGEESSTVDYTEETWDKVITINLKGVWLGMKYAIPEMIKSGGGSVINTSSQAADRGLPNLAAYTASKGGVSALSREAAVEYAAHNVRVNWLSPGTIATPLLMGISEEAKRFFISRIPQGRFGTPEEVANVALFLASDESSHVTGHNLVVDGGIQAR